VQVMVNSCAACAVASVLPLCVTTQSRVDE
jgi:hypothetical protein